VEHFHYKNGLNLLWQFKEEIMTATLWRSEIGTVDYAPGTLLLSTTDDLSTVTTAGYLNNAAAASSVQIRPTDFIMANYGDGSGLFTLTISGGVYTMVAVGGVSIPVSVADGGTGETSLSAYEVLAGGTTDTGAIQSIPSVSAGYVLTDNGPGVLPSFQAGGSSGSVLLDPGVGVNQIIVNGFLRAVHGFQAGSPAAQNGFIYLHSSNHTQPAIEYIGANNLGAYTVRVENAAYGQSTVLTIPDVNISAASFIMSDNSTGQTISTGSFTVAQDAIISGSPGNSGEIVIEDGTANYLVIACTGALGNQVNFVPTGTFGQNTNFLLSDPGATNAYITGLQSNGSEANHLVKFANTNGLMSDSGISSTDVQLNTNIRAQKSGNIGGSGAGPISVSVAGLTSSSVVVASIVSSSNPVSIIAVTTGSGAFDITFSADPGASAIISYVAFIAAQ